MESELVFDRDNFRASTYKALRQSNEPVLLLQLVWKPSSANTVVVVGMGRRDPSFKETVSMPISSELKGSDKLHSDLRSAVLNVYNCWAKHRKECDNG